MGRPEAGFREREHTADWELQVWAPELAALFEQAARGMYALTGTRPQDGPRQERELEVQAEDLEGLLVAFLSELLYLGEIEGLCFEVFEISLGDGILRARLQGAPIASQVKEIKAVTYHNLVVRETERGFEANLVFDV